LAEANICSKCLAKSGHGNLITSTQVFLRRKKDPVKSTGGAADKGGWVGK